MAPSNHKPSLTTRIAQALHYLDPETGAVVPPIAPSATYARDAAYEPRQEYWYKRDGSETSAHAEAMIAELEGAADSLLFTSGMAAAVALIEALPAGSHVVVQSAMFHGVLLQFQRSEARGQLQVDYFEPGDLDGMAAALRPGETQMVWIETPCNMEWEITDIAEAARLSHAAGAMLITDCTATPPNATRALELGADISFHSATKYLNGHSDVVAGVLSTARRDDYWDEVLLNRKLQGTVLQPFDAWLLIRGLRTLFLRVEKATQNALTFAAHFEGHPKLTRVAYPGLPSHPGHEIAKAQTGGLYGGMLSIFVRGDKAAALRVIAGCQVFYPATSLGGVESLIEHRETISGEALPVDPTMLRLSIGIEDVNDLIADLETALAAI